MNAGFPFGSPPKVSGATNIRGDKRIYMNGSSSTQIAPKRTVGNRPGLTVQRRRSEWQLAAKNDVFYFRIDEYPRRIMYLGLDHCNEVRSP